MAESFLADHYDTFAKQESPSERTLVRPRRPFPRGMGDWQSPFGPAGAVQNKVADAAMCERLAFRAHAGHACGLHFKAASHLAAHRISSGRKTPSRHGRAGMDGFLRLQITANLPS